MKKILTTIFTATIALCAIAAPKTYVALSPDGKLKVNVTEGKNIAYTLTYDGTQLISPSPISMSLADGSIYGGTMKAKKALLKSVDESIKTVAYKKASVKDHYNELTLQYATFDLKFRVYDDGMAYRFISKAAEPFTIKSEQATFAFPSDWKAYVPYSNGYLPTIEGQFMNSFENYYVHCPISQLDTKRIAFLPLVVEAPDSVKLCITEADLLDYPGMFLKGDGTSTLHSIMAQYPKKIIQGGHNMLQGVIKSREDFIAKASAGESFPWRVVMVAPQAKDLANMDMVYRLGTPASGGNWDWVKPGKVAWDWWNDWNVYGVDFKAGINNDTYKYYIDFASEHHIEYVILDEGWAVNKQADLMQVVPEIDLKELVSYASERKVGLILWAGYWAFNRDMDGVCKHYSQMGIKGFKVDFMNRDDQPMVDFYTQAAKTAAKYHLMLDFHGAFKPAGLMRTYPNVVNFEGVAGLEQMKWQPATTDQVTYDVTLPFIRLAAGPMDYTQGSMRNAVKENYRPINSEPISQGTRCHQLAEYVIFDAPLTMLCDSPSNYLREPECTAFISAIPTTWKQTIALDGHIAEYIVMAKQAADGSWYVGALNNWTARDIAVDMHFLDNALYDMTIFQDGVNADRAACDYKKVSAKAPANRLFQIHLAPGGGWAAHLVRH